MSLYKYVHSGRPHRILVGDGGNLIEYSYSFDRYLRNPLKTTFGAQEQDGYRLQFTQIQSAVEDEIFMQLAERSLSSIHVKFHVKRYDPSVYLDSIAVAQTETKPLELDFSRISWIENEPKIENCSYQELGWNGSDPSIRTGKAGMGDALNALMAMYRIKYPSKFADQIVYEARKAVYEPSMDLYKKASFSVSNFGKEVLKDRDLSSAIKALPSIGFRLDLGVHINTAAYNSWIMYGYIKKQQHEIGSPARLINEWGFGFKGTF